VNLVPKHLFTPQHTPNSVRKLRNEEFHDFYLSPIRKCREMRVEFWWETSRAGKIWKT